MTDIVAGVAILAAAIDAAPDPRADVQRRHRAEWVEHKALVDAAVADSDFEKARLAKILAETIRIRQDGERKAWGLDKPAESGDVDAGPITRIEWTVVDPQVCDA